MMQHQWNNGGRLLVFAAATAASSVITLAVVFIAVTVWPEEEPFVPVTVSDVTINSRLEGVDGPAVRVGSHYNGTIEICNSDDEPHTITFVIQVERLSGPVHFVDLAPVDFPKQPGCETFTGDSAALPRAVTPGLWRESSSAVIQQGNNRQTISFVSDQFEVVP
jgi:hypothetical protein